MCRAIWSRTAQGTGCIPPGQDGSSFFADAACTTNVALIDPDARADFIAQATGCNEVHHYVIGDAYTGPVFQKLNGTCASFTTTAYTFTTIGAELDFSRYVLGSVSLGTESGRIVTRNWTGAEGSVARLGLYDKTRDEPCGFAQGTAFRGMRCIPGAVPSLGDYADAACSVPVAIDYVPSCPKQYLIEFDPRGAGFYSIDQAAPAPTQRFSYGGSCIANVLQPGFTYVVGGASIPLDQFATATERID